MAKVNYSDVDVDDIKKFPIWQSFLNATAELYTEYVTGPLTMLQNIRNIGSTTDLTIVKNTLSDMGLDIAPDIIVEPERLYKFIYSIPLLYQVTGRREGYRALQFLLGRRVAVYNLYTKDYHDFQTKPWGALRVDGGDWYKTTHVDLEMEMVPTDSGILLPPGTTLEDRLLSAFYSYAPITVVVRNFYYVIEVANTEDFGIQGVVYRHPTRFLEVSATEYSSYIIVGPDTVESGKSYTYRLLADSVDVTNATWSSDSPGYVSFGQQVSFTGFATDSVVILSATIGTRTITKTVTVKLPLTIGNLVISGLDSLYMNQSAQYQLIAYTPTGQQTIDATITTISPYAKMVNNTLYADTLSQDQQCVLGATIVVDGVTYNASKTVQLVYADPDVHLTGITITGPSTLLENTSQEYDCIATFSNGTTMAVLALWESSSTTIYIDNGIATTALVSGATPVTLSCTYQYKDVQKTAEKDVSVVSGAVSLVGLAVIGATSMYEEKTTNFSCTATLSDGSSTLVNPEWSTTRFFIDQRGKFVAGLAKRDVVATITASYQGMTATQTVSITQAPVYMQSLIISGSSSVQNGVITDYDAFVKYSNGLVKPVTATWSVVDAPDWATCVDGSLLVEDPEDTTLVLSATYTKDSVTLTQEKTVVCIKNTNKIVGLTLTGADSVKSGSRITLVATATYEDGTTSEVSPVWSVYTNDSNAEYIAADIYDGIVVGRPVQEDMVVVVLATYYEQTVEKEITVEYVSPMGPDVPQSTRIIGPSVVYSTQNPGYAQAIIFEACASELQVSSDWSLDTDTTDNDLASIDENGFVTISSNTAFTFTVTGTWSCGGYTASASKTVSCLPVEGTYSSLVVSGDDYIEIGQTSTFTVLAYASDSTEGVTVSAEWEVLSDNTNIQVLQDGSIKLLNAVTSQTITLSATYTDQSFSISGLKTIQVLYSKPLYVNEGQSVSYGSLFDVSLDASSEFTNTFTQYLYVMVPQIYGAATFTDDHSNPISFNDPVPYTRLTNGVNVVWNVYRSTSANLGQLTVRPKYAGVV